LAKQFYQPVSLGSTTCRNCSPYHNDQINRGASDFVQAEGLFYHPLRPVAINRPEQFFLADYDTQLGTYGWFPNKKNLEVLVRDAIRLKTAIKTLCIKNSLRDTERVYSFIPRVLHGPWHDEH